MIIYGWNEIRQKRSVKENYICPNCGENAFVIYYFFKYVHIFWIPMFPYGRRNIIACEKCNYGVEDQYDKDIKSIREREAGTKRVPVYLFSGLIFIALVISLAILLDDGLTTYKYSSGQKQSEGKIVNNLENGAWIFWHPNGKIATTCYFKNGLEDSVFTWYDEDGNIKKVQTYKEGITHGLFIEYYSNGQKATEGKYENNREQGRWSSWYENGQKNTEGSFERSRKTGKWTYWYENGSLYTEGNYKQDTMSGKWTYYFENGSKQKEVEFKNGEEVIKNLWDEKGTQLLKDGTGKIKYYYDGNNLAVIGEFKNGIATGNWKYYYVDGTIKEEGYYKDNLYHYINTYSMDGKQMVINGNGQHIERYEDQTILSKGMIRKGLADGKWLYYLPEGSITAEYNYKDGKFNGKVKTYYSTGELEYEGEMENNVNVGIATWYHLNGNKSTEIVFVNGKKEGKQTFWGESGSVNKIEYYKNGILEKEEVL